VYDAKLKPSLSRAVATVEPIVKCGMLSLRVLCALTPLYFPMYDRGDYTVRKGVATQRMPGGEPAVCVRVEEEE
jgi:hypothetical protein